MCKLLVLQCGVSAKEARELVQTMKENGIMKEKNSKIEWNWNGEMEGGEEKEGERKKKESEKAKSKKSKKKKAAKKKQKTNSENGMVDDSKAAETDSTSASSNSNGMEVESSSSSSSSSKSQIEPKQQKTTSDEELSSSTESKSKKKRKNDVQEGNEEKIKSDHTNGSNGVSNGKNSSDEVCHRCKQSGHFASKMSNAEKGEDIARGSIVKHNLKAKDRESVESSS